MNYNLSPKIKIFNDVEQLSEHIGNFWKAKTINLNSNEYYSVALSGGRTPIKIFQYLSIHFKYELDWKRIKFFWVDERCVPPSDADSNYKLAKDNLFDQINIPEKNIFRIFGEAKPNLEALRYSNLLSSELEIQNVAPKFDYILLGMGEDGHTASIFPNQIELFHSQNYCEVAEHPSSGQKRITLTGKIINNADIVVIAAIGNSKAEKVSNIIKHKNNTDLYPVSFVKPISGKLYWLLDKDSASLI